KWLGLSSLAIDQFSACKQTPRTSHDSTVVNCGCVYTTIQTTLYTTKMRNAATAPKRRTVRLVLGASSAALLPNARAKLKFLIAMKDGPLFVGKSCCTIPSAIPPEVTGRAASF